MEADERVLQLRNEMKEAKKQAHSETAVEEALKRSIYDPEVDIFGHPTVFGERLLLDGLVAMRIPEDFVCLEEDVIHTLYPLGNRPQVVMGNEPFYFMLGFNYTQHHVPEEQIKEFPLLAKAMLERGGPKTKVLSSEAVLCGGRSVAVMELVNEALEGAMYNVMFYSNAAGRLLIGFINFRYQDRKRLQPLAREMIGSYRILADKGEDVS